MRIWKLFQRHYEQRVLHKAAKGLRPVVLFVIWEHLFAFDNREELSHHLRVETLPS